MLISIIPNEVDAKPYNVIIIYHNCFYHRLRRRTEYTRTAIRNKIKLEVSWCCCVVGQNNMKNRCMYHILLSSIYRAYSSRVIYKVCRILVHYFLTNNILKEYVVLTSAAALYSWRTLYVYRRLSNDYIVGT